MLASLMMILSLMVPSISASGANDEIHQSLYNQKKVAKEKLTNRLLDDFKKDDEVTFLVKFTEKADTKKAAKAARKDAKTAKLSSQKAKFLQRSAVVSELKTTSHESQKNVVDFLEKAVENGDVKDFKSYYIVNGMAVTATKEIAEKIASFPEVEKILPNETRKLHETFIKEKQKAPKSTFENVEWNVERVGAPQAWEMGFDGTGTVVASLDTGVQWDHPGLKEKYRGYDAATGDVDHQYSFYDPATGQEEGYDDHGHGTHVTGTMVGSEPDGSNQVGVAPGAQWIAVKVFNESGSTTDDVLLAGAEWILAPGGRVDMAPDVVNNSWGGGPGLDEWYRDAVRAWRDAEIFPEFSAGNTTLFNPGGPGSVAVPANYPESFATGATDIDDMIAEFSLRGPSPYDEIKPDISAPGVNIRSTVPGSGYEGGWNGTSMSGPAVSGVAALLRQVNADMTVDEMEEVLISTATPRTDDEYPESPNNGYGYGIVNAHDAVASISDGLGTVSGQVTKEGTDDEAPTFEHKAPKETYSGMDLDLEINVADNISVTSVELNYQSNDGDWKKVAADRTSGDYKDGVYTVTIPGEDMEEGSLTYKWTVNDFGNNEVSSDEYVVDVKAGITVGYTEDFEQKPMGWTSFGEENSWEWGVPTSGPERAASGENVYATNLEGTYESNMNATLVMPPIDLPDGDAYLQFKHWHDFEKYSSGNAYDFGHVFISTDQEDWTQLMTVEGASDGWEDAEVDLSEYSNQRVYVAFNATSDISIVGDGWYLDDVALSDQTLDRKTSLNKSKNLPGLQRGEIGVGKQSVSKNEPEKKAVDPKKITPLKPKKERTKEADRQISSNLLPLGAQVSVLETNRTVYTDPADGSYSLMHGAGSYTIQAEAYGFHSQEQEATIEDKKTTTADFTLEEMTKGTVTGKITDEATEEAIENATLLLLEDANIAAVESDQDGSYSLTAYEGTYTLKVMAVGYHSKEVEVSIDGDVNLDISLEPMYTYPGGEIGYDDGTAENARAFYDAGNGWAVKMSLDEGEETALITDGVFRFWDTEWPVPGGVEFAVEVWDASGKDGLPGEKLAGPIEAEALRTGEWTIVDLSEHNIVVDGDFYMVYMQTEDNPYSPGLATDEDSPNAERSYQFVSGAWSKSPADEGNYMIRARVDYEVKDPVITAPEEDLITNEEEVTIEGTASPTTTIQLLNNGEEVDTVDVEDDGTFTIDTELVEGKNEFTAVSLLNEAVTGESKAVTITLDTSAPELTIDQPTDGGKTNRETVTVEGTVADDNLDYVEVNGAEATVKDGKYSKRILLEQGENTIEVLAMDAAENATKKSVTIAAKFDAPEIDNLTPDEDQHIEAGESVKVEFESEPGLDATFVIHMPLTNTKGAKVQNATELPIRETSPGHYEGYWTATKNAYAEGAVIEVIVIDSFDNETREKAEGKLFINVDQ